MPFNPSELTEKAHEAVVAAQRLAEERQHTQIEPEHLMRTLVAQEGGVVPAVLEKMGVRPQAVLSQVDQALGGMARAHEPVEVSVSPRLRRVLNAAQAEADQLDEIAIFRPLGLEQIKEIVDIQLKSLRKRLAERKIELVLTPAAREHLAREGFDPVYGARPLKRAIQKEIVQPLAMRLLRGEFHDGDTTAVDVRDGLLEFRRRETQKDEEEASA